MHGEIDSHGYWLHGRGHAWADLNGCMGRVMHGQTCMAAWAGSCTPLLTVVDGGRQQGACRHPGAVRVVRIHHLQPYSRGGGGAAWTATYPAIPHPGPHGCKVIPFRTWQIALHQPRRSPPPPHLQPLQLALHQSRVGVREEATLVDPDEVHGDLGQQEAAEVWGTGGV